jgi:hypothetical protein
VDSSFVRLAAQVALTTWAIAQIALLVSAHRRAPGTRWAVLALVCFAGWMFLLSVSSVAAGPIARGDLLWPLAVLEVGTAVGAWGWLVATLRARFRVVVQCGGCDA